MKNKFKEGDKICYKLYPDIYIGIISYVSIFEDDVIYSIFTSKEWIEKFSFGGNFNSTVEFERNLELYIEK